MKSFRGIVGHGRKRAGALGFPTINIQLEDASVSGIYAARVEFWGGEYIAAAFADPKRKILEAHLLDFTRRFAARQNSGLTGHLYGKTVRIKLCAKIRDSKQFTDDAALREAITKDVKEVREYFLSADRRGAK